VKLFEFNVKFLKDTPFILKPLEMLKIFETLLPEHILDLTFISIVFSGDGIDKDPIFPQNNSTKSKIGKSEQVKSDIP
jgi:hypothetical protein